MSISFHNRSNREPTALELNGHRADYVNSVTKVEDRLGIIRLNKSFAVNKKVGELNKAITKLPDTKPKRKGNKTMKQHLVWLRDLYLNDPDRALQREIDRLEQIKANAEFSIQEIDQINGDRG